MAVVGTPDGGTARSDSVVAKAQPSVAVEHQAPYLTNKDDVATTVGMVAGTFYTVLLSVIFLPAFAVMRWRADAAAARACAANPTEAARQEWLTKHDLGPAMPKQLTSLLALLGPVLVGGPGTALLKLFAE
jgi:hypothetical protein